ncbi:hypothetical protein [Catellatospora tritici]|uniref:hypothetical protein n=1 Tax=Catellatospora tritici TaxID=2851566 RepID=UPI001C2DD35A|nr:hypothetical protein [Catellatospora tritici]MBV1856426.1 hypothetical protein [Catellatospora tritici]
MSSTTRSLSALSCGVALAALAANFVASGFTADNVQSGLDAVQGGPSASAEDIFTVGTVFVASAPIVLAVIASALVYQHGSREKWTGNGLVGGILAVWVGAVLLSGAFVSPASAAVANAAAARGVQGPPAFAVAQLLGKWIFTAYGVKLTFQGLAVGIVAVLVFLYFTDKWKTEDAAAAAKEAPRTSGTPPMGS